MMLLQRMWINQPSTLQRHHSLHGQNVLADISEDGPYTRIWFTSGDIVSMEIEHASSVAELDRTACHSTERPGDDVSYFWWVASTESKFISWFPLLAKAIIHKACLQAAEAIEARREHSAEYRRLKAIEAAMNGALAYARETSGCKMENNVCTSPDHHAAENRLVACVNDLHTSAEAALGDMDQEVLWRLNGQMARFCFRKGVAIQQVSTNSKELVETTPAEIKTKLTIKKYWSLRSAQRFVSSRAAIVREMFEGELTINPIVEGIWLIEMTVPVYCRELNLTEVI